MKKLSFILCGLLVSGQVVADTTSDLMGLGMPAALASKVASTFAPLASPTFTGTVSAPAVVVSSDSGITGSSNNLILKRSNQTGTLQINAGTSQDYSTGANIFMEGDDVGGTDAGGNVLINSSDNSNADVSIDINGANSQFRIRNSADADQFTIERFGLINTYNQIVGNGDTFGWSVQSGANTACTTTCTNSAVVGFDTGTSVIVGPADATADLCLCAGAS